MVSGYFGFKVQLTPILIPDVPLFQIVKYNLYKGNLNWMANEITPEVFKYPEVWVKKKIIVVFKLNFTEIHQL